MSISEFTVDILNNKDNYYFANNFKINYIEQNPIELKDIALFRIDEISFEDKAPRKEALENVLSSMKIDGVNFIYLILGDEKGVHFYYGIAKNLSSNNETDLSIKDIGKYILEPSIKGNFRGSKVCEINADNKKEVRDIINGMKYYSILEGVPGYTKDDEKFQCADRLADVMMGDTFGFMIIASPLNFDEIKQIESNLYDVYTKLVPLSKKSIQDGNSDNKGTSKGTTDGTSETKGENYSKTSNEGVTITDGTNEGETKGSNSSTSKGTSSSKNSGGSSSSSSNSTNSGSSEGKSYSKNNGKNHSESKNRGGSESQGTSRSIAVNSSKSIQESTSTTISKSTTIEFTDKKSQDWIKYLDDVIIPRLDYGTGKGIFITSSFMFSNNKAILKKLENTAISLYSGENGNKVPLRSMELNRDNKRNAAIKESLKNFQLPKGGYKKENSVDNILCRAALSQFVETNKEFSLGNWITTNELAMIAGLPQKEVVGLALKEEVEFGLNFENSIKSENKINIGNLVKSGNVIENIEVYLDKTNLDKHIFITGVTGSGKTTTCQKILLDSELPFLVIEPAKTEYRILTEKFDDLIVFTLGKDTITPFRLNPFEFFEHESITSRVDMIRASIEASFEMEAAIPQIIETAIYKSYEEYGWNIATNKNTIWGDRAFDDGVYSFPTLSDIVKNVESVVDEQGFDTRLRNDYIGSIKARLQGLLVGSKGLMLNTKRSIDFEDLLDKKVVLELEEIRGGAEKSLIMGFVLTNLIEAIKAKFYKQGIHNHITLVEEAHRLLSKFTTGDSYNKKQGVETFSDMLAEIRKYGESLMIVDQIPNKLTPEVLKNTNTKIVHRLFAEDDKEAIGNTIVLEKEQKEFLSNLETGRAIVFTQGFEKAIQVKIKEEINTSSNTQIEIERLQKMVYMYYAKNYKRGIICGSQYFDEEPKLDDIAKLVEVSKVFQNDFERIRVLINDNKVIELNKIRDKFKNGIDAYGIDIICKYILATQNNNDISFLEELKNKIENFVNDNFSKRDVKSLFSKLNECFKR